ncbi:MAG: sulfatase-like hydrolase/transferase [Verrucomicrobiales bacterium]
MRIHILVLALFPLLAAHAAERPNIVYIISDDHDYEHLGFMGNAFVKTPTLDSLAGNGTIFTTAHLPMSRCHPTLASFLSGRNPHQSGIYYNFGSARLNPESSLPSLLQAAGYATYCEGKFWEGDPRAMGFTHGAGKTAKSFVRKGQSDLFKFIDENSGNKPMMIWWAPLLPHTPHNPPQKYLDAYDWQKMPMPDYMKGAGKETIQSWKKKERLSYAMEAWLDDGLAQLVKKLKAKDEFGSTLFVFVIDNGWCNGLPSKGSPFEKGVRTPVFFSWPGKIKSNQRLDNLISTNDIYPTILDYLDIPVPNSAAGKSLMPAIFGDAKYPFREILFGASYPAFATRDDERPARDIYALYARSDKWKYIYYLQDVRQVRNSKYFRIQSICTDYPEREAGEEDLFAIDNDPYELKDLANKEVHAELKTRLKAQVLSWWTRTGGEPLTLK